MAMDVFMSVGRTTSDEQEQFVEAVETWLRVHELRPVALGRNEWSSEQPLKAIRKRMEACAGTVIVAFERTHIHEGIDRGVPGGGGSLADRGLPTVWNQVEAAMAHTLGHPLLVIVEEGLVSEGLFEARYDWMVQWLPLEADALETAKCVGILEDWKGQLVPPTTPVPVTGEDGPEDITGKTIGEILGQLRPGQFRALVVGTVGTLVTIAGAAFSLGVKFG
jgi:hypothetical protein